MGTRSSVVQRNNTSLSVESVISQAGVCDMHLTYLDTKSLVGNAGRIVVLGHVSACFAPSHVWSFFSELLREGG